MSSARSSCQCKHNSVRIHVFTQFWSSLHGKLNGTLNHNNLVSDKWGIFTSSLQVLLDHCWPEYTQAEPQPVTRYPVRHDCLHNVWVICLVLWMRLERLHLTRAVQGATWWHYQNTWDQCTIQLIYRTMSYAIHTCYIRQGLSHV